jgi:membrane protease YdiL (CAAX protease family)
MRLDCQDAAVRAALEAEYLETMIGAGITAEHYTETSVYVQRLLVVAPDCANARSYAALIQVMTHSQNTAEAKNALQDLVALSAEFPHSIDVQVATVRAAIQLEQLRLARRALATAETVSPSDRRLEQLRQFISKSPHVQATLIPESGFSISWQALRVVGFSLIVSVALWFFACLLELGSNEYFYTGTDWFWYLRRTLLVAAAIGGAALVGGQSIGEYFSKVGYRFRAVFLLFAVVIGVGVGLVSPTQRVTGLPLVVMLLTLIHVVVEQMFFNGFVTRQLLASIARKPVAIGLSALLFGLYHISYYSFYVETSAKWIPYWVLVVTLGAGLPYAALYARSRSIVPPLICHLLVNGVMMVSSLQLG